MWRADPFSDPKPLIRSVYAYVAYRLGDGPEAEDVAGETFARALRYRDSFDPRKGEPIGWLIGIARRCIADAALSRRSYQELDEAAEPPAPGDVEADTLRRIELREAVASLDEAGRELVALALRRRPERAPDRRADRQIHARRRGRALPHARAAAQEPREAGNA